MQASLAELANRGVIVNYLDLTQIGNVVEANLSAFGLISAGACPIACVTTDPSLLSKYLFYVDQLHLTSRGFEIVGQYAVRQLEAPLTFESQTDLGLSSASNFGQLMSGRLDLAGGGGEGNPLSFYLVATTASHDVAASNTSLSYDYDSFGVAGGAEYDLGTGMIGVALAYSRPNTDSISGTSRARAEAYHIGAYGQFEAGGAFAEAYGGIGRLDYRIRRAAVINEIEADTEGDSLVAGGEAGYLFQLQGFRAGPVVGAQYARVEMDEYTERGDPVLTLNVSEQRAAELVGFAGVEAQLRTEVGGLDVAPFVKLLAEKELDRSGGSIRYALTGAPMIVNRFELEEGEDDVYARIEGGASFELAPGLALQLQASATVEHPEHDEFSGSLGVKLSF
jgi:outer membrane autotransporter protein